MRPPSLPYLRMTVWMGSARTSHELFKSAASLSWFSCSLEMPAEVLHSGGLLLDERAGRHYQL